jgi:plastocyanin
MRAGEGKSATRGVRRARLGTLLIAAGGLAACVGSPAALVSASSPPPGAGSTVETPEAEPPPAPPPQPSVSPPPEPSETTPPPETGVPGPEATPPPDQGSGDDISTPGDLVAGSTTGQAKSASVSILDGSSQSAFRFSPSSITVGSGDTVTWTNNGSEPHDVTGSGLASGTLNPGQGYSQAFSSPGTFSYICSIHPFMRGSVTVQARGGGEEAGTPGSDSGTTSGDTGVTGPGSESEAVTAPGAAGSGTQLPSSGMPVAPLLVGGAALLALGTLMRRRRP